MLCNQGGFSPVDLCKVREVTSNYSRMVVLGTLECVETRNEILGAYNHERFSGGPLEDPNPPGVSG